MMYFRAATAAEIDLAYAFVDVARTFQRAQGFVQWKDDNPNRDTIAADIAAGKGYFLCADDVPQGYIYLDPDGEPAYDALTWQSNAPYLTIHRVALATETSGKGLSRDLFRLARAFATAHGLGGIRIDTHADNARMRHILAREGFVCRGKVSYGTEERLAYEYLLPYTDFTLLIDGKAAFPAILDAIATAQNSLYINMFIWRDDDIGNRMAEAVLAAAERGVKVTLSVDRYGVVLEKSEECRRSFFHKTQTLVERIKSGFLSLVYPMPGTPRRARDRITPLYTAISSHPNITLDCDRFKADHSKFYIMDDKVLFLGGINIEDKENGADMQGRVYGDYMVRLCGAEYVAAFLAKRADGIERIPHICTFPQNCKEGCVHRFEIESHFLSLINEAERELSITMAYVSALPHFERAILAAAKRGVTVTICIPARANYQDATNRRAMRRLYRKSGGNIRILLSPKMLHTKLLVSEKTISLGSANITKKAFSQLAELNLALANVPSPFCDALLANMHTTFAEARRVTSERDLSCNRLLAWLEGFLV